MLKIFLFACKQCLNQAGPPQVLVASVISLRDFILRVNTEKFPPINRYSFLLDQDFASVKMNIALRMDN